ncbi:MAG: hypothetical protein IJK08_04365, partial [Prevotella sp.]|nr:hypothetical protein [Prevotella sp.]
MRLTPQQALERLQGTGMRRARGKTLRLLRSVKSSRRDRLFVFGRGDSAIVAPADDALQPVVAEFDMESGVINPAAQLMLDDYARAVAMVQ